MPSGVAVPVTQSEYVVVALSASFWDPPLFLVYTYSMFDTLFMAPYGVSYSKRAVTTLPEDFRLT